MSENKQNAQVLETVRIARVSSELHMHDDKASVASCANLCSIWQSYYVLSIRIHQLHADIPCIT